MKGAYLYELAHCRAGDKGSDSLLVVIPYAADDFEPLRRALTQELVADHFALASAECVLIRSLPALGVLVITIPGLLAGGVTRASGADPHGKTLSSHLLDLRLPAQLA